MVNSRVLAFVLLASLLVLGMSSSALKRSAFAADDLWYPGEGVKQDIYVKYKIEQLDTNDGRPFEMTIYFEIQMDGKWLAPIFVVDQGHVIKGTLKLADTMAPLSGEGADVPAEMSPYVGGYKNSLQWLDAFSTKSAPKSLTAASWGKLACIGCEDLKSRGQEKVTVPAGTYDTTVVGWHRGQTDSELWILDGFPFPIKALTYADVTTGSPPILFKFDLLETGSGKPTAPASKEEIPTPPLSKKTGRGNYAIRIDWEPAVIEPNKSILFSVSLSDSTGFPLERANYDLSVKDSKGNVIKELKNQNADAQLGTGTHELNFETVGPMTITVKINSISGVDTGQFTESADFNILVVPEFPVSATIVATIVIGLVVVMTRSRSASIGSLFGGSGISP